MEISKARRKTFEVDFVEVTVDNLTEVANWSGGTLVGEGKDAYIRLEDENARNAHQKKAFVGDLILKSQTGFKKYTRKSFEQTFEEIMDLHIDRSASSGEFVTHEEALAHPDTTVSETVTVTQKGSGHTATVPKSELPHDADPS